MAKVIEEAKNDIPVREMKDGEVGVITKCGNLSSDIGLVVQRYGEEIVYIGMSSGFSFDNIPQSDDCRLRILPKGTKIEL